MKLGQIVNYDSIAACLARESDEVQRNFFKAFLKELRYVCETHHDLEMQLTHVREGFTSDDIECFKTLSYTEE